MKWLIAVTTSEKFLDRRKRCKAWIKPSKADIFFVVGRPGKAKREGDTLYVPCGDGYYDLVSKTYNICKFVLENYEFDYLFKCDDDSYVIIDRLLQVNSDASYLGTGTFCPHKKVFYAEGGAGYRLKKDAIQCIVDKIDLNNENKFEDSLVGQTLRDNGFKLEDDKRFCQSLKIVPTVGNNQISCHGIRSDEDLEVVESSWNIHSHGYWLSMDGHCVDLNLASKLSEIFKNRTVMDIGCGDGKYVNYFLSKGINIKGYDGNPLTNGNQCFVADFAVEQDLGLSDWVLCLEVAEHVPVEFEDILLKNLHKHNRKGIVLSWAIPGQVGKGHVNCRTNDYVKIKMKSLGYVFDDYTEQLRNSVTYCDWLRNTLMVFRKGIKVL